MKNEFPDPGFLFAPLYIIRSICNRFGVLREDPCLSVLVSLTSICSNDMRPIFFKLA